MRIQDLEKEIQKFGLNPLNYNLGNNQIIRELQLGIRKENNEYVVFQSLEKGRMNIIKKFDNEDDACNLFMEYLKDDKEEQDFFNK